MYEGEALLELRDGLFLNFISPTGNVLDSHSNDSMVSLLWTSQCQNTRFQYRRLKTQSSGGSKKTIPPFSRTIGQSVNCLEHEIHLERRQAAFGHKGYAPS